MSIKSDIVDAPAHYDGDISPAAFCRSFMTAEEYRGWCKGKIIHYIARAGKKSYSADMTDDGCARIDCKKANWCLNELLNTYDGD